MAKLIRGLKLELGGEEYIVPPLNIDAAELFEDDIARLSAGGMPAKEQMGLVSRIVHTALARNYPDISAETVRGWIDMGNMIECMQCVMGQSGYTPRAEYAGAVGADEAPKK